jgi:hypothetical protein
MDKVRWHVTMSLDGFIAGPNDAMEWVFSYVPLDSPATRSMLEEVIRSNRVSAERQAKLQRGKEARTAPRSAEGSRRRLERPGIRAHSQGSSGRSGSVNQIPVGGHPERDRRGVRRRRREERP